MSVLGIKMYFSFKKHQRLSGKKNFQYVFKHGCRFRQDMFTVLKRATHRKYGRLGIIIPKKIVRFSTQRHYLKRVIRESFRLNPRLCQGYDIIIMMKYPISPDTNLQNICLLAWKKLYLKQSLL